MASRAGYVRLLSTINKKFPMHSTQRPMLIGHRGAAGLAPENTIASFAKAIEIGVDAVELDVRASRDGQVVVIHDAAVDRTTNGAGKVADLSAAEIRGLDAGGWFGPKYAGQRIPLLREALKLIGVETVCCVEVKELGLAREIADIIQKAGASDSVRVLSFMAEYGAALKSLSVGLPFVLLGAPSAEEIESDPRAWIRRAIEAEATALSLQFRGIVPHLVSEAHAAGLDVWAWTVNELGDMLHLVEMGVDAIASDRPDILVRTLRPDGKVP